MTVVPATKIDRRYSDPAAEPVSWPDTVRALESAELFWLTTVRPDGRPHATPLVGVWGEGKVHFQTGSTEVKYANLQANPHVVLITGCSTWDRGLDIVVEGTAVQVTDQATLERLAPLWKAKWDGRWDLEAVEGGFRERSSEEAGGSAVASPAPTTPVFSVTPVKIDAHAKGDPFGATTHRF